jgi:hypothetical protein
VKILEQRLRIRTSGTSAYSHTYDDHDDSQNPCSSQDCGSRWRWTGIQKLHSTTACSGGEISHLRSPSGGHAGERERYGGGRRPGGGGGRWPGEEGLVELCCALLSWAPSLYRGCTLAPSPRHQGWLPREEKGGGGWGRWGQADPQNPNPGQPVPGVQCAPLFLPLMGFFLEIGPLGVLHIFNYLININSFS